jgi:hypothetical protein
MLRLLIAGALIASVLFGCSGETTLNCEPSERYAGARSVPPVRVPEDLSVPDEAESLRLPPAPDRGVNAGERCLESPPDFFEERRPGEREPAEPAPAQRAPAAEPELDPEREISN